MPRRIILVVIALLIAGGAVFLVQMVLRGPGGRSATPHDPSRDHPAVQVLVAKNNLYTGQFVTPADLTWQAWPDGAVPATYAVQGKTRQEEFVGAVVTDRLAPGDPITLAHVVKPGDRGFMAAVLQPGDRAVTVNVTPSTGMAGFLFPGDRVDLILTQTVQSGGANSVSRHVSETILHGIRVVGLDQTLTDQRDDKKTPTVPKTATLEVSPKQAEIVAVANDIGVLTLALNSVAGPHDPQTPQPVTKTWDVEATEIAVAPASPAASASRAGPATASAPRGWTVEVVRGGSSTPASFSTPSPTPTGPIS